MDKVVDEVGLDKIAELTDEFNQKMINDRELRIMARTESKSKDTTQVIKNKKD